MNIQAAISMTILYYLLMVSDYAIGWQTLQRPIVIAPLAGLLLGDFETGIIMGASLEAVFMGISAIGGSVPADALSSSIISVSYVVLTGATMEEALAISMPVGALLSMVNALMMPVMAMSTPVFENYAKSGDTKGYNRLHIIFLTVIMPLVGSLIMFLSIGFGIEQLQMILGTLPEFIMTGIQAAAGMLPAIGFAIITSMIWSKETGMFFFLGFVLSKYLELSAVPIAIIGTIVALSIFFQERKIMEAKNTGVVNSHEEDFF